MSPESNAHCVFARRGVLTKTSNHVGRAGRGHQPQGLLAVHPQFQRLVVRGAHKLIARRGARIAADLPGIAQRRHWD